MMKYDDNLVQLQQKAAMKKQLEAKLNELHTQRREYDREVISLRVAFHREQEDVEKLEGRSLANYFFQVIGKLDDKLDKEHRDAYAARVKLDAAERELAGIEQDIQDIQSRLAEARIAEVQSRRSWKRNGPPRRQPVRKSRSLCSKGELVRWKPRSGKSKKRFPPDTAPEALPRESSPSWMMPTAGIPGI